MKNDLYYSAAAQRLDEAIKGLQLCLSGDEKIRNSKLERRILNLQRILAGVRDAQSFARTRKSDAYDY